MATARKSKTKSVDTLNSSPRPYKGAGRVIPPIARLIDNAYRFFASLRLAVFGLITLSAVLAYATFFESWYGTHAAQEWIYRSRAFALLLAFLGINIFCAALIRFRWDGRQKGWTRRQTGFVITHAGLLVVLLGSWITLKTSDEGQVMLPEGETTDQMVRLDHSLIRVEPLDPRTGEPEPGRGVAVPFRPGAFSWDSGEDADRSATTPHVFGDPWAWSVRATVASLAASTALMTFLILRSRCVAVRRGRRAAELLVQGALAVCAIFTGLHLGYPVGRGRRDVLIGPGSPIGLVVRDYIAAASMPVWVHDPGPTGPRKIKMSFEIQPPGFPAPVDLFRESNRSRWLEIDDPRIDLAAYRRGPITVTFSHVDTADKLDDFLHPPEDPLHDREALFHYTDKAGEPRVLEWPIDEGRIDRPFTLPDSDLEVTFRGLDEAVLRRGAEPFRMASFGVRRGDGPEIRHTAIAGMPMVPNIIPARDEGRTPGPLLRVAYYHPPAIGEGAIGPRSGVVEVLATDSGSLYWRAYHRHGMRGPAPLSLGEDIEVFGPGSPMKARFRVDEYHESGGLEKTYLPLELPKGQADSGIPACLVELRVGDDRREIWLRRGEDIDDRPYERVVVGGNPYRLAFDFDRRPLGFDLALADFDVSTDPGTHEASSYASRVLVNDPERGVESKAATITMNRPMWHRGMTFYQASFRELRDPETGRKTGAKKSVIQVGIDPFWGIKYLGCLTVVLGTFVQFYMRAGVFTDGGKREQARAEQALRTLKARRAATVAAEDRDEAVTVDEEL